MKTKIVYAVTSDDSDIYLDQLILSIQTLRFHNINVKVCLVVDKVTEATFLGIREKIYSLVDEIVSIKTPEGFDKKTRSRYIKTLVRQNVSGRYLFIDTDTIITSDLSEIDQYEVDVAACLDRHLPLKDNQMRNSIINQMRAICLNPNEHDDKYYNSGVMFVNETPKAHMLYEFWHKHWYESQMAGTNIDQPSLALSNKELGYIIDELPHIWNCQILGNGLKYIEKAKIVHYYNTNTRTKIKNTPFLLTNDNVFRNFRKHNYNQGALVCEAATTPCALFYEKNELLSDEALAAYYSEAFQMLNYLYGFHPRLFTVINKVCKAIFKCSSK